uniref:Uncharacterized protein n=1 Tax=Pygocentrus nattereri TaxID=42514 RepID=A0AAR2L3G4_PYGNA
SLPPSVCLFTIVGISTHYFSTHADLIKAAIPLSVGSLVQIKTILMQTWMETKLSTVSLLLNLINFAHKFWCTMLILTFFS